jgi:desulfoferrodoxin (superoxide reductase-like protein)
MNIPPFTDFDSLDNFICPICKVNKDMFVEIEEIIHESTNENSLIELEEKHIPFYKIKNDKIIVQIGTEELSHPNTPEHFI